MAAPNGTVWGEIKGSYGRIGIYTSISNVDLKSTVSIQVWFWSKYSVSDSNNRFYFDNNATTATTEKTGDIVVKHTVSSGDGWSTSNQTRLATYSYTYTRTASAQKKSCAAKFSGIDAVKNGATMTVTASYTVPALPTYTVTFDANGGSGAPSSQSKLHGSTIKLSAAIPTRTGYTFLGWNSSATATEPTYSAGGDFTANLNTTLYAVWLADTFDVIFDANGGTGAPAKQTKTYDVTLTLSSTIPTRTNYNFLGWSASENATTASYQAGGSYVANSEITLYAVWKLAYTSPRITGLSVTRCSSNGTVIDDGTYFKIAFSWATDKTITSIVVKWKTSSVTTWSSSTIAASGTSGTVSSVLGEGAVSTEFSYDIILVVSDEVGSSTVTRSIPSLAYIVDFLAGGKGMAIGKPATRSGVFEVGLKQLDMFGSLVGNGLAAYSGGGDVGIDPDTTLESLAVTNNNTPIGDFMYIGTMFYNTKSETANRVQIAIPYRTSGNTYRRFYYDGSWSEWINTALDSYPVNSFYIGYSHTSPAELFGGTWTRITERFLYAAPTTGTIGATAGEKTHTLTVSEMPAHTHVAGYKRYDVYGSGTLDAVFWSSNADGINGSYNTSSVGSGVEHNNMPPYVYVAIWRRTA